MITEWFCFFSPKTVRTLFTIFFSRILKTVRAYCIRKTIRSVLYFEYNPRGLFLVEDCRQKFAEHYFASWIMEISSDEAFENDGEKSSCKIETKILSFFNDCWKYKLFLFYWGLCHYLPMCVENLLIQISYSHKFIFR